MPLKGGLKQGILKNRKRLVELDVVPDPAPACKHAKRKKAKTIGSFLSSMFMVGRLTAPEVNEAASAIVNYDKSGCEEVVKKMAKPSSAKNASTRLVHQLGKESQTCEIYSADIITWDDARHCQATSEAHFHLPYEYFDARVEAGKSSVAEMCNVPQNCAHGSKDTRMERMGWSEH